MQYSVHTTGRFLLKNKGKERQVISEVLRYNAKELEGWYGPHKVVIRGGGKTFVFEPNEKIKLPKGKTNAKFTK